MNAPITTLPRCPVTAADTAAADACNRSGIACWTNGNPHGALEQFRQAARQDPGFALAWNNSGLVLHVLGRPAEALADFDRALAARADYPEALANRGRARQALGDFAGALADFDRALELVAGTAAAPVLHNRGALRQAQGDLGAAVADYDRALAADPAHLATLVNRAAAHKEAGDLDGALADCERALAALPPDKQAAALHVRGGVRALRNDFAGAAADYDRALTLEPWNFLFHISRGNARYHLRDRRAAADYRCAFRLDADGAAREIIRLAAADARRDAKGVLDNCRKHLRINSRDVLAYARRGLTLVVLARTEEALPDFARVAELAPAVWQDLSRVLDRIRGCRQADGVAHYAMQTKL
jgi:tetratricopeptide (TPR) repeat protein